MKIYLETLYLLETLITKTEYSQFHLMIYELKIFKNLNGSGCHTNFSTEKMREGSDGMPYIEDMMGKFKDTHLAHMEMYGQDNEKRLTGIHETSAYRQFSYGAGNRAASIRIPT